MLTENLPVLKKFLPASIAIGFLFVGCGSADTTDDSTTTTMAAPVTSAAPTTTTSLLPTTTSTTAPTTTTTLDEAGVLHTFIGYITDPALTARAEVTIDVAFADFEISGAGEAKLAGANSHMIIEFPNLPVREVLTVNEVEYVRSGDGPWTIDMGAEDPFASPGDATQAPLEDLQFAAFLQTLGDLEHQGAVNRGGNLLHRVGLPEGQQPDPVGFGFEPDDVGRFEVSFLATSAGLPHEFWFEVEDLSNPDGPMTLTLVMSFVEFGIPVPISPPEDVWLTHRSDAGYSISHPADWDVDTYSRTGDYSEDRLFGLHGEELAIFVNSIDPPGTVPLNAWLEGFRSSAEEEGATMGPAGEYEFSGLPARKVRFTYDDGYAPVFAIYVVIQTDPATVFEFIMFGDEANEVESLLGDFLSTFVTS